MSVIELYPTFLCPYYKDGWGVEKMYEGVFDAKGLVLFKDKEGEQGWLNDKKSHALEMGNWNMYLLYKKIYTKKITLKEVERLVEEDSKIQNVIVVGTDQFKRLYYREDIENNYDILQTDNQELNLEEEVYMLKRKNVSEDNVVIEEQMYYKIYPVVSIPIFTVDKLYWAEELEGNTEDYYIEKTTLRDLKSWLGLGTNDTVSFNLSMGTAPHYVLGKKDLEIVLGD